MTDQKPDDQKGLKPEEHGGAESDIENISHFQSEAHTDPAIPTEGAPESKDSERKKVDPYDRTRHYRDAA